MQNLDLAKSNRQLILMGKMKRKQGNLSFDIQVFLFDHCLVLSKIKQVDQIDHYKVIQKPIPLESLSISTTAGKKENKRSFINSLSFFSTKIPIHEFETKRQSIPSNYIL
jgi:hypothetical protein